MMINVTRTSRSITVKNMQILLDCEQTRFVRKADRIVKCSPFGQKLNSQFLANFRRRMTMTNWSQKHRLYGMKNYILDSTSVQSYILPCSVSPCSVISWAPVSDVRFKISTVTLGIVVRRIFPIAHNTVITHWFTDKTSIRKTTHHLKHTSSIVPEYLQYLKQIYSLAHITEQRKASAYCRAP